MTHTYSKEELLKLGRSEIRAAHGLTNESKFSDEFIIEQIEKMVDEVRNYVGYDFDMDPGTPGYNAIKFYGLIKAAYFSKSERGPTSVSHARRFDYDNDTNLIYWRNRMIRAISKL